MDVVDVDEEDVPGGEVMGGKGIQIDLLHRRLGHTSKSVMERLVREGMVRGLEDGSSLCVRDAKWVEQATFDTREKIQSLERRNLWSSSTQTLLGRSNL